MLKKFIFSRIWFFKYNFLRKFFFLKKILEKINLAALLCAQLNFVSLLPIYAAQMLFTNAKSALGHTRNIFVTHVTLTFQWITVKLHTSSNIYCIIHLTYDVRDSIMVRVLAIVTILHRNNTKCQGDWKFLSMSCHTRNAISSHSRG